VREFTWPVRVYWEDTDAGGVVYHASYVRYLERARTEWLRELGLAQAQMAEQEGVLFSVIELDIKYLRPARLDDLLQVVCSAKVTGGASVQFEQRIVRGENEIIAQGSVRVACLDAKLWKPQRLPAALMGSLA
jgi:acyl-CoA thioester hydrolase